MEASQTCLLSLLLIAAATYGIPTTSNPQVNGPHVPHEPRSQPEHPPHHEVVADKPVQPIAPRDGNVGSIQCTMDANCTSSVMGPDSICHGNICTCNAETTQSPDTQRCLRTSSLGSGCSEDWQCSRPIGNFASCKNHICTCNPDTALVNGKCWKQKHLSDSCTADEECIGGHDSTCQDSRCVCKTGMVPKPSNDKCLRVATKFQDPCDEAIQCTEPFGSGSVCTSGKCVCQDGYHFKNHECMKNLILGDQCGTAIDGDCFLVHSMGLEHVACTNGQCTCKGDLIPSSDNQKCLAQGQTDPGSGGGAESVQPLLITLVTILLARLLSS